MAVRVAINGFGRVGRVALRLLESASKNLEIVAINDVTDSKTLAHLLKYDSIHGPFSGTVSTDGTSLTVNGRAINVLSIKNLDELPWKDLGIEIVLECTGLFTDRIRAGKHIERGAKKVIISAPAKEPDITIVKGVNDDKYNPKEHNIISNASCTTNCLAPMVKVVLKNFGFVKGQMTTIHSYTNDQRVLDLPHKDLRRARAAALSMIPTTTGAARAVSLVLPETKGKLDGIAIRVPTPNVSLVDLACVTERAVSVQTINDAFRSASNDYLKGLLKFSEEPLVSADYNGDLHSCIFDSLMTNVVTDNLVKIFGWYDNESGYSARLLDLALLVASKL